MHDVGKVAVIIESVDPVAVVNVAIAVIVDSVVVAIGFVSIHIGAEVLVVDIQSGSELYKLQPGERRETAHHLTGSSRTRLRTGHLRCRWAIPNQKLVGNVLRCAIPHAASSEIRLLRRYIDRERYEKRRKDNPRSGAHGEDS